MESRKDMQKKKKSLKEYINFSISLIFELAYQGQQLSICLCI